MKKPSMQPLSDDELDFLDQFLLYRGDKDIDDQAFDESKDEGIFTIAGLDGLLTAVVSSPEVVQPSRWLPAVWKDEKEFEDIFTLMVRFMNSIVAVLMEQPEDFEPLFMEREVDGKTYTIVDEWCEGYLRGVMLSLELWGIETKPMDTLILPIIGFTQTGDWFGHELEGIDEIEKLQNAIAPNVRKIHAYWSARRDDYPHEKSTPGYQHEPKVGRNEPCPCGSGKKFKKCCLH